MVEREGLGVAFGGAIAEIDTWVVNLPQNQSIDSPDVEMGDSDCA